MHHQQIINEMVLTDSDRSTSVIDAFIHECCTYSEGLFTLRPQALLPMPEGLNDREADQWVILHWGGHILHHTTVLRYIEQSSLWIKFNLIGESANPLVSAIAERYPSLKVAHHAYVVIEQDRHIYEAGVESVEQVKVKVGAIWGESCNFGKTGS